MLCACSLIKWATSIFSLSTRFYLCILPVVKIKAAISDVDNCPLINKRTRHSFIFGNNYSSCLLCIVHNDFATLNPYGLLMRI